MISKYVPVMMACVALCGTAFLAAREDHRSRALDELRRELASRPERPLDADAPPNAARDRGPAVAEQAPSARGPEEPNDEVAVALDQPKPPIAPEEARERFDAIFAKEPTDTGWARDQARVVTTRVDAVLPEASSLRSVECHTALCRIETTHENPKAYGAFLDGAFKNFDTRLGTGGVFMMPQGQDDRGRTIIVTYLARDGEDLPNIEAM